MTYRASVRMGRASAGKGPTGGCLVPRTKAPMVAATPAATIPIAPRTTIFPRLIEAPTSCSLLRLLIEYVFSSRKDPDGEGQEHRARDQNHPDTEGAGQDLDNDGKWPFRRRVVPKQGAQISRQGQAWHIPRQVREQLPREEVEQARDQGPTEKNAQERE